MEVGWGSRAMHYLKRKAEGCCRAVSHRQEGIEGNEEEEDADVKREQFRIQDGRPFKAISAQHREDFSHHKGQIMKSLNREKLLESHWCLCACTSCTKAVPSRLIFLVAHREG